MQLLDNFSIYFSSAHFRGDNLWTFSRQPEILELNLMNIIEMYSLIFSNEYIASLYNFRLRKLVLRGKFLICYNTHIHKHTHTLAMNQRECVWHNAVLVFIEELQTVKDCARNRAKNPELNRCSHLDLMTLKSSVD